MAKRSFLVRSVWDDEAKVFVSESDIVGLHIEAATEDEFGVLMMELAPDLIVANHLSKVELTDSAISDLIPAIVWERWGQPHRTVA